MSDSLLQACLRSLSQAHLCVYLNICMAYSPGLIHTAVSQSWWRSSGLSLSRCSSTQNICASLFSCFITDLHKEGLSYLTQTLLFPPHAAACFIHEKNPSISHSPSLCVSLDFFFSSSLLCFWSEHPCIVCAVASGLKWKRAVIESLEDESAGRSLLFSSLPCQTCSHSSPRSEREREGCGQDPAVMVW